VRRVGAAVTMAAMWVFADSLYTTLLDNMPYIVAGIALALALGFYAVNQRLWRIEEALRRIEQRQQPPPPPPPPPL
jgi:hypothetical protein